jgi:hypothetical protein
MHRIVDNRHKSVQYIIYSHVDIDDDDKSFTNVETFLFEEDAAFVAGHQPLCYVDMVTEMSLL